MIRAAEPSRTTLRRRTGRSFNSVVILQLWTSLTFWKSYDIQEKALFTSDRAPSGQRHNCVWLLCKGGGPNPAVHFLIFHNTLMHPVSPLGFTYPGAVEKPYDYHERCFLLCFRIAFVYTIPVYTVTGTLTVPAKFTLVFKLINRNWKTKVLRGLSAFY